MGLFDKLVGKGIDLAVEEGRAQRDARRSLRADLRNELRQYSTSIEALRIELHKVRRQVLSGDLVGLLRRETKTELKDNETRLVERLARAGLDTDEYQVVSNALELKIYEILSGNPDPFVPITADVSSARKEFDTKWAALRPILQESIEIEAFKALRITRHLVLDAEAVVYAAIASELERPVGERDSERIVEALDSLLTILDRWSSHIFGVSKEAQRG